MRRRIGQAALIVAAAAGSSTDAVSQDDVTFNWRTFAQLTAEHVEGLDDGVGFGADRIRIRLEGTRGVLTGGFMLDFGVEDPGDREPGALANLVGDLYLNYRPDANHLVRFGQFKTPIGMDFNVSGGNLDITKRGLDAGLVLGRDLGVMLSGRRVWKGFGYDIGLFNPAGRSLATEHIRGQVGDDSAPVVRLHYDSGSWHAEIAHGRSDAAGGPGTRTYRVSDAAVSFRRHDWNAKVEWIEGQDIRGATGWVERVYYFHGAYRLGPRLELVARYYRGRNTLSEASTELSNTYLGATAHVWSNGPMSGRLQVNYVVAGDDGTGYTGLRGFRDDAILLQFQVEASR